MDNRFHPNNPLSMPFECSLHRTSEATFPVPLHWHYFGELIFIKEGLLKVICNSTAYFLHPGELLFINPLANHSLDQGDSQPAVYEIIRLDMEQLGELPSYTPDLRSVMLEAEQHKFPMKLGAEETHKTHMDFMIDRCVEEYRSQSYGYDLNIRALLYLIVTSLIRLWIKNGFTPQGRGSQIDPIYTVTSYIARHIQEPLKVEDLAASCGLSYPWFARKFHHIYGISCKDFIEKVRIQKVEHFLLFTDCDLNYICRNTGYADCSHLVRDFRKFHSMTPGQFRQINRQKVASLGQFPQNY